MRQVNQCRVQEGGGRSTKPRTSARTAAGDAILSRRAIQLRITVHEQVLRAHQSQGERTAWSSADSSLIKVTSSYTIQPYPRRPRRERENIAKRFVINHVHKRKKKRKRKGARLEKRCQKPEDRDKIKTLLPPSPKWTRHNTLTPRRWTFRSARVHHSAPGAASRSPQPPPSRVLCTVRRSSITGP